MGNFAGKEGLDERITPCVSAVSKDELRNVSFDFMGTRVGEEKHEVPYPDSEILVPTVFRWEHGGRQVYITGTFNNWEQQIPMHRSGNDFT